MPASYLKPCDKNCGVKKTLNFTVKPFFKGHTLYMRFQMQNENVFLHIKIIKKDKKATEKTKTKNINDNLTLPWPEECPR